MHLGNISDNEKQHSCCLFQCVPAHKNQYWGKLETKGSFIIKSEEHVRPFHVANILEGSFCVSSGKHAFWISTLKWYLKCPCGVHRHTMIYFMMWGFYLFKKDFAQHLRFLLEDGRDDRLRKSILSQSRRCKSHMSWALSNEDLLYRNPSISCGLFNTGKAVLSWQKIRSCSSGSWVHICTMALCEYSGLTLKSTRSL